MLLLMSTSLLTLPLYFLNSLMAKRDERQVLKFAIV